MKVNFFDGKKIAAGKERELKKEVERLRRKGITPGLVSIVVGDVGGGKFYQSLKKKAAQRIGAEIKIISLNPSVSLGEIKAKIEKYNSDVKVHGVMVQLPLPGNLKLKTKDLINAIDPQKDVDGLREDSQFLTPVVKAVLAALIEASYVLSSESVQLKTGLKIVVVGAKGFEGAKITRVLKEMGYKVEGVDVATKNIKLRPEDDRPLAEKTKNADILISVTGSPGLIRPEMVKEGVAVIDIGSPKGDVDKAAYKKAVFVSPVPGGIGPVTISSLLENLVEACQEKTDGGKRKYKNK